jgi:hypothetical protein
METARKLGFGESGGCGFGFWVPGVAGRCFYSTGLGLGVRATPSRRGRAAALGLGKESRPVPSSGMTGGSPASEREKRGKGRSGLGRELGRRKGNGPRGTGWREVVWAAEREKERENGLG